MKFPVCDENRDRQSRSFYPWFRCFALAPPGHPTLREGTGSTPKPGVGSMGEEPKIINKRELGKP